MSTIAVTGGAGYIGSHTCKALAQAGHDPVVIDNMSYGHPWAVKWGALEQGDIGDGAFLDSVFAKWKPAAVIHFAGLIQVGESVRRPRHLLSSQRGRNALAARPDAGAQHRTHRFFKHCRRFWATGRDAAP